ncbi:MAG: restriction endonuclease subunit S [Acidobacteria bacterium]|nr:restriction endonuclease subunit S [Acidobacteriota bacterium]
MSNPWPLVALRELLTPVSRPEVVDPEAIYHILGAHWYAQGLYTKNVTAGSEIQAKVVYRVQQGDFVYNRLFGWKGSFAVATDGNHGCYVSNEFPCFTVHQDRADGRYIWRYFSLPSVWNEVLSLSAGGTPTSRNRLKEEQLLAMKLPLPPLDEQRRIVSRIEELATKIEQAKSLRKHIEKDSHELLLTLYSKIIKDAKCLPMAEAAPLKRRPVHVDPSADYYELGIRSFGKGAFHKPSISGTALGTKKIFRIEPGDLLFNIVFAWEGAIAVAKPEDHGRVGSHRFLTCVPKDRLVTSSFLCFHFLTERGLQQLGEASPGGAGRNRTLGLNALEKIEVPVPPFDKQLWFDSYKAKLDSVQLLRNKAAAELDALMPSILSKAFSGNL